MEAESNCSSSWLLLVLPDPVEVSDIELPDEKGGKDLSDNDGEAGLRMKLPVSGDSTRRRVSYWREPQSDIVRDKGAPDCRLLGLYFGASLNVTRKKISLNFHSNCKKCVFQIFILTGSVGPFHYGYFLKRNIISGTPCMCVKVILS